MNDRRQAMIVQQGQSGLGTAGLVFSALGWFTCGLLCIPGALLSFLGLFSRGPKGYAVAGLIVGFPGVLFFLFVGMGIIGTFFAAGEAASEAARRAEQRQQETWNEEVEPLSPATTDEVPVAGDADADADTGPELETAAATAGTTLEKPARADADTAAGDEAREPAEELLPREDGDITEETDSDSEGLAEGAQAINDLDAMPPAEKHPLRTWSDATGKFSVDAHFVKMAFGDVTIRTPEGREITIAKDRLSKDDQAWIEDLH